MKPCQIPGAYSSREVFDYGRGMVGFRGDVEQVVVWLSVRIKLFR